MYALVILESVLLAAGPAEVAANAPADPAAAEALSKFRAWAEAIADLPSIHFEFDSFLSIRGASRVFHGRYDYDITEGKAYLEYTSPTGADPFPLREYASWSDGVGFLLQIKGVPPERTVMKYSRAPDVLGYTHMPSCHPCFPGRRSLATSLEGKEIRVEKAGDLDDAYRVAVFRRRDAGPEDDSPEPNGTWMVYMIQPQRNAILLEERRYFTEPPPFQLSPLIPPGLELPEEYRARYLHVRKVLKSYRPLRGVHLPTRWEITMPSGNGRAEVRIDEDSLSAGLSPEHAYRVPILDTDTVNDRGRGVRYAAADPEHVSLTAGEITEARIDELLQESGIVATPARSRERHVAFPSSCARKSLQGTTCPFRRSSSTWKKERSRAPSRCA